jgi:hypothetical protein
MEGFLTDSQALQMPILVKLRNEHNKTHMK